MAKVASHGGVDSHSMAVATPPTSMQTEPMTCGDFRRPVHVRKTPVATPQMVVKSAGEEMRRPARAGESPWTTSK